MATWNLEIPLKKEDLEKLNVGDIVNLSGIIYSCRDAAHKRIVAAIDKNEPIPFELEGQAIYYMGPSPTPEGRVIGSCGPTTSYRMDAYAPRLYSLGLGASIGKGKRSPEVRQALQDHKGVYLLATGGAGALLSKCIKEMEVIAFPELGPEAVRRLKVENLPLLVGNDTHGKQLYSEPNIDEALAKLK